MAENNVSAPQSSRDISASRLINRQAEEQVDREARVISRQQNSQEARKQAIVETQTGGNVNIRV